MSLKDLWKAGKLENERRYYCRLKYCGNTIVTYKGEYLMHDRFDAIKRDDELEILDIVPSYEELQKIKSENDFMDAECKRLSQEDTDHIFDCIKLKNEVESLRELLKECYSKFTRYQVDGAEPTYKELVEMCTKINSVIGESEE